MRTKDAVMASSGRTGEIGESRMSSVEKKTDDLAQCRQIATEALARMVALRVAPTPANFSIWYAYFSSDVPDLTKEIDALLENGAIFSMQVNIALFNKYFGTDREAVALSDIGQSLNATIGTIMSQLSEAGRETAAFDSRLQRVSGTLNSKGEQIDLKEVVASLVAATEEMSAKNKALENELNKSADRVSHLQQNLETLRVEVLTDSLTGIGNRKLFDLSVLNRANEANTKNSELCLLMLDIDHFKRFNDSFGHRVGDKVLRVVANRLKAAAKPGDLPVRYGGEEFAMILPNITLEAATVRANQIREELANQYLRNKATGDNFGKITVSIGVTQFRHQEQLEDFIQRADAALYRAKDAGRNQVIAQAAAA
jgi:diguanylate cyclase